MKKQFLLSVLLVLNLQIFAQNKSQLTATPAVKIPITVSDGAGGSQILHFGLDKTATDGLDASLEEQALPPLPPAGVFDARFNLNATEASLIDIRHALNAPYFTGSKVHEIQYQVGTGTTITISWNLPAGVTGKLQDVVLGTIIDVAMNSAGSYTVNNPGVFNKLKLTIEYKLLPPTATKYIITPSDLNPVAGSNITVTAQLASDNGTSVAEAEKIITWSKTGTGGSFGSPTSTTDANGKATVQFTTHTVAGTIHKITGTTGTLTGTSSDITTKAGAYAKLKVTAAPLDPVAGEKSVITVQLQDVNGNDVKEAKQINFVSTKGTIAPNAMTDAGTGSVSVDLTTDTKSGINHTVTATDNVDNAIKTDSPLITTKAGAYAKLKITASTVTPVAGEKVQITVQLQDKNDNDVKAAKQIKFTSDKGSIVGSATTDAATGLVTVDLTTDTKSGVAHTVNVEDGTDNTIKATSPLVTTKVGAFAKIKVTASTLAPVAGDKVQITAQLQDKNGNDIKAARQINFSTNKGSVAANGTTDAGTGSVTIDLTTDTKSGIGHTVTAVDNANTEIKSDTQLITTVAGIGVKYLLTTANATPKFDTEIIINAQLVDVNNNAVPTATPRTINWASTNGGTFSGATGTDVTGKATVNFKVSNVVNTTHEVTATDNVDGTIKGTLSITTVAGPPSKYIVTTSNATPVAGEDITIKAQLTDEGNNPHKIPNITVNWTFTGTGGELADTKSKTDQNGIAEVKFKTSKTANTAHTVTAKDSVPREGTTNTFTTKAGAYAKLKVTAAPLDPVAGEKTVITVQLQDINGNDVKEAKQISFTTDKGTLENPATKTTDALTGKTTIELTTDTKSGTVHKVTANDGTTNFDAPVITTKSGAYAKLKITASTVTPVAGEKVQITVQLQDKNDNDVKAAKQIKFTSDKGSIVGSATTDAATGLVTVDLTTDTKSGVAHTVNVEDGTDNTIKANSPLITTKAGTASKYVVTSSQNNPAAGSDVTIEAQLTDQYGNVVLTAGKIVTWSKTGTGGNFGSSTSTTDANGKASVVLTVSQTALTTHKVTATDNSTPFITGSSGDIITKADVAIKYTVISSNNSPVAGSNVIINAQLKDKYDNNVLTEGKVVSWSSTNGGSFVSTTSNTNTLGLASIVFSTNKVVGTKHIITATDDAAVTGNSNEFTTVFSPPTKYIVTASKDNPDAGEQITLTAQLSDNDNNPIGIPGKVVSWVIDGALQSVTSNTDATGKTIFQLTTSKAANVFHVVSVYDNSVPSLTGRKSDIKTIPGPGSKYIVQASDYNPSANSTIQISARLVDQYDNFVLEAGKVITWRSTFGGKFGSATSITNASGEAKVDFNVHSQSGTLHIITATDNSSPALTGKTDYIDVKAGMAVKYYLSVSHNNPVAGDKITITALLIDEYLNLVAQSGKVIRWTSTNEGTFSSAASVVNNGEAKVEFTTNKKTNTRHAIKAKDADGIEGEIDGIVTRSGAGSKYLVISSSYNPPSGSVVVLTAQFSDDAGNAIKQADLEINWSSTNGGVFSSLTSKTDSDGKASVNFTTSNTTGTKHIIKAVDAQNRTGSSDEITTVNISPVKYLVASSNYEPFFGEKVSITAQLVDDKDNPVGIGGRDITWTSTNGGTFDKQTTKTDETGKASVEFTTSATANVKHNITANDNTKLTGTSKEIITQTLNAPILVSPIPQEENVPVQAKFAWRKSSKAEKYQLQVSTSSGFASLFHDATTPDTTKEVLTTYKTVYYWRVRAIRGTYISAWSEVRHYRSIVQKPGIPVLTAPVNNALNTPINLQLNWSPSFEAITYNLHISNNQDFSSLLVDQRGITSANYNLTQLQHDKKYYWKVSATNPAGNSEFSTVFSFTTIDTVLKPTNVSAIVDKELKVNLTWTDNANNETGFDIERTGPDGNTFALLRSVSANTTLIQDSEVVEGKRYKYRLRAKKNELYSVYSEIEEVTIPIKEIIPPVDLTIKPQPTGWLLLTWQFGTSNSIGGNIMSSTLNDILGVIVEREVYETPNSSIKLRYSSPMGSFVAIDTLPPNSTQYLDKDVKEGVRYNYRVSNYTTKGLSVPAVPKAPIITLLAPTALKVTKQGDAASLIWTDNTNLETGFYVTRTDKQDRNRYKLIDSTSANITSFTDNTVADGQTYYYQVYSYSGTLGFSAPTNTDSVSFAFKAPTELTVAKEAAFSIKVKWNDNSKSEIGYKIERKASDETAFKELVKTAANVSSYNDETVIDNKSYSYRVYAVISATELSIVTNTQTIDIPFYMPSDMKLTKASANKIQITWKDNSKSEAGYIVERKIKGEAQFKELNKTAANIVTYTDDNLADGKIYYYRIAGLTSATTSSNPTAVDSLTLPMIAPSDVTAKLAVDNNKMQITVTWKDNSQSETGYKIERKEGTGAYKEVGSVLANISTYTDADIVKNKDYTYRVKGYNADVTSDYSIEKVISDVIEQLVPTNFSISQNYPNPFNPTTKIKFALPQNGSTKLTIYNTLGESVVELINKELEAGYHEVEWNASQHSSGVYFYEIRSSDKISVKKMMLLK